MGGGEGGQRNRRAAVEKSDRLGAVAGDRRFAAGLAADMKPAPFDYVRPDSLAEACRLLAGDEDARLIAGGQTLVPMLARVLPWVGHPPTRNRGTVGGSIANADPSAEIPLVAVTLGADILLATTDGPSSMPADDFFIGPMLTTIAPGECVSAVKFPVWRH